MLARDKHTSLFQNFVNYVRKKLYLLGPGVVAATHIVSMYRRDLKAKKTLIYAGKFFNLFIYLFIYFNILATALIMSCVDTEMK
jgi:hypothetical protein